MKNLALVVCLILLSQCSISDSINQDEFIKIWRLSEIISISSDTPEVAEVMQPMVQQLLLKEGLVLAFYPDRTYALITGYNIDDGSWSLSNDNKIVFGGNRLDVEKFEAKQDRRFLIGTLYLNDKDTGLKLRLTEEAEMLEDFTKDPFYPSNNQWRKKPAAKESEAQIKDRLLNYILHFAYVLNASFERKNEVVSLSQSLGIIRVYRGGIGRVKKDNIPEEWSNCFYDKEDAMKAYDLFSKYLNRGLYKGASTGDWVKDNYQILMTIFNEMKMN